jgi:SAM-dependent methyltransferase
VAIDPLIAQCRLCADPLPPLNWDLSGMPKSAQNFPSAQELEEDFPLHLDIRQCAGCGLVQLANGPVSYYREVIRASGVSVEMAAFRKEQFATFIREFDLINRRGVEIGCGNGEYLNLLVEQGLHMTGVEYSENAVQNCRGKGFNVHRQFLSDPEVVIQDGEYSACFMFNFLEHLPAPNKVLQGIAANLSEEGVGIIEVPNFDMILRSSMFTEICSDHLLYFTQDTFQQILSRNGFEVLECNSVWQDYILSARVKKRPLLPVDGFKKAQHRLTKSLAGYLQRFDPGSVVVWGAGHQALAVMAAGDLKGRIRYVIDSADFKQGKLTPATHIPIVHPDTLNSDPPSAIIVMAAAYSEEIVNIIRRTYGNQFDVAVLQGQELIENY